MPDSWSSPGESTTTLAIATYSEGLLREFQGLRRWLQALFWMALVLFQIFGLNAWVASLSFPKPETATACQWAFAVVLFLLCGCCLLATLIFSVSWGLAAQNQRKALRILEFLPWVETESRGKRSIGYGSLQMNRIPFDP